MAQNGFVKYAKKHDKVVRSAKHGISGIAKIKKEMAYEQNASKT